MRKLLLIATIAVLAIALFLTACGDDKKDKITGPAEVTFSNADWDVMFIDAGFDFDAKENHFAIMAYWMGDMAGMNPEDSAHLIVGEEEVPLQNMFVAFIGYAMLNAGQTYNVKFILNGVEKVSTSMTLPHSCQGTFPNTYNPSAATTFSWTLGQDSQYQYAGVSSYNEYNEDQEDDDVKFISTSARNHTVKANAVQSYGSSTVYELFVGQMNFKVQNRIAITAIGGSGQSYGYSKDMDPQTRLERTRKFVTRLRSSL